MVEEAFGNAGSGWLVQVDTLLATPVVKASIVYPMKRDLMVVSLETRQEHLADLLSWIEGTKKLRYHDHVEERIVANTQGTLIETVVPTVQLTVGAVLPTGNFLRRFGRRGGAEVLTGEEIAQFFSELKSDQEFQAEQKEVQPDPDLPVLVDPPLLGMIVHDIGHSFEADFILADGTWVAETVGKKIGPNRLHMVDDPTIPGSNASFAYDDEGVQAEKTELIVNGVATGLLHSRSTASLVGTQRAGNARTFGATDPVLVRMSNTVLATGDTPKQDLLRVVKRLIFLKGARFTKTSDHRTGEFEITIEQGFLVEDGVITGRLPASSVAGKAQQFLDGLIALSSESEFISSTCGKWGPENTMALVGQIAPYALVAKGVLKLR